jgi:uncharacterized pyridoxal phosphate-containing UPF0001 family protein
MTSATERRSTILDSIASAARLAKRDPAEVQLIAVTKTHPASEIEPLIAAGQRDFGESRVQEAQDKWPALRAAHPDLRLHCIGRLQSNKAVDAVALFDTIHSLDRPSLLDALVAAGIAAGRFPSVYVQVLPAFLDRVRASPLPLVGLMAIPPLGPQPGPFFALLAKLAKRHDVTGLSMGMSSDYPTAVMLGATAVRVGTALFD